MLGERYSWRREGARGRWRRQGDGGQGHQRIFWLVMWSGCRKEQLTRSGRTIFNRGRLSKNRWLSSYTEWSLFWPICWKTHLLFLLFCQDCQPDLLKCPNSKSSPFLIGSTLEPEDLMFLVECVYVECWELGIFHIFSWLLRCLTVTWIIRWGGWLRQVCTFRRQWHCWFQLRG